MTDNALGQSNSPPSGEPTVAPTIPPEPPPQPMVTPNELSGSFVIAEPSQPTSVNTPQFETVVVPDGTATSTVDGPTTTPETVPPATDTQFMPQGLMDTPDSAAPPPISTPPPGRKFPIRTLGIVMLLLLVVGGIVFAALRFFNGGASIGSRPVTITYWGLWEQESILAPVIRDFQSKYPNITVEYKKENHREYRQRLQTQLQQGTGPDAFRFHTMWVAMLKDDIEPLPADSISPDTVQASYYPVVAQDLVGGTTVWGLPVGIDGLGLYVNEELFQKAGVTVPASYEDLITLVPQLTVKDGETIVTSAIALGTTNNIEHVSDILALMFMQNGASLTDLSTPLAEEVAVFYRKFATPSDPLYTWNEQMDNSVAAFASGRVAMMIAPSWRAFEVATLNPDLLFRIEPVPQLPGTTVTWASYWAEGVARKSQHKSEAAAFITYLTSREGVTAMYTQAAKERLFGEPYALVELGSQLQDDQYVGAYIKQAPYARSFPLASNTHDGGINDRMNKYLLDAVNSIAAGTAPKQALTTASQGFSQVLTQYGLVSSRQP